MLENLVVRNAERLIILDDFFPNLVTAFRVAEINFLLSHFDTAIAYSTYPDRRAFQAYSGCYPQFADRVRKFHPLRHLKGSVSYAIFLNNIFGFLRYLERAQLPFVFELYPGGGFRLDDPVSDAHLRCVVESPLFRKVVVTQKTTRDYLLCKKFCRSDQMEFIFGGVMPSDSLRQMPDHTVCYGFNKKNLDICFVAYKYTPRGEDKGYDRFIECARLLYGRHPEIRFHVVGNFTEHDIELGELRDSIKFYGVQFTPFFPQFYSRMDLILSPNIPFLLAPGAFDGFPTGCCVEAALCGTAMFVTDPLGMNEGRLKDDEEVVIIPSEPEQIARIIERYMFEPAKLTLLAQNGKRAVQKLFALDVQMAPRLLVLERLLS